MRPFGPSHYECNLPLDGVVEIVESFAKLIEHGFGPAEVERLIDLMTGLADDEERWLDFTVSAGGVECWIRVGFCMYGDRAADLLIAGDEPLIRQMIDAAEAVVMYGD